MCPKFILENFEKEGLVMIIGKVQYHKQLAYKKENIISGGWWRIDNNLKIFYLYGDSFDFGAAKLYDIKKCIESKKVFSSYNMTNNLTDNFKFVYITHLNEHIYL